MATAIDTDRAFGPAEIVRIHEANCSIEYATAEEQNFRLAVMKHIARRMGLPELKTAQMSGPGVGRPRPANTKGA
jgi:hypothetical protein